MTRASRSCLLALLLAWPIAARAEFTAGNSVEVREGDVWSAAEYLAAEGRRHQIRYADGTEEWVSLDRIREATGAGADAGGSADPTPADDAATAERDTEREARRRLQELRRAKTVEFKTHSRWEEATIKQASGPLFLVATNDSWGEKEFFWKWVGAERLRLPGEDFEGPDAFDQFDESVGSAGIRKSLAKALEAYPEHAAEQAAKAEQAARRGGADPDPFSAPPLGQPTIEPDRSALQLLPLATAQTGEDAAARIDPRADAAGRVGGRDVRLAITGGGPFGGVEKLDLRGETGLVVIENDEPGKVTRIQAERIDLRTGRSSGVLPFDAASLPLSISPDGSRVLAMSNGFHSGTRNRLDLWNWPGTGDEPEHVVSFEPFRGDSRHEGDVADAVLIDGKLAVITGRDGSVSGWNVEDARAVWGWSGVEAAAGATPSPGGRLVAVRVDGGVALLDASAGDCVLSMPGDAEGTAPLAFSADGRYLAATDRNVLTLWDLEAGQALPSVAVPPDVKGPTVPLTDGRVRVGDRLFEPATGHHGRVGALGGGTAASATDAGRVYVVMKDGGRRGQDATYTLHRPDPTAGLERLGLNAGLLLREGDLVSLDLSKLSVPAEAREGLTKSISEQLAARGVKVEPGQPVKLVATSEAETKTLTYETFGGPPSQRERTDVRATQTTLRFAVEADGQPAWEVNRTYGSHGGGMVFPKEGQSIQQALDAQNRVGGSAFGGLRLPDHIPDPRAYAGG